MRARTIFYSFIIALCPAHFGWATEKPAHSEVELAEVELENAPEPAHPTASTDIAILPPVVQFLSMESNASIEAPKAEEEEISKAIADAIKAALTEEGIAASFIPIAAFQGQSPDVTAAAIYDYVRGKKNAVHSDEIASTLTRLAADEISSENYLIIRARFYLDYWARSGRGWQVATSILSADRSDKRMVIDARLHEADGLAEKWRTRMQERVTPRASEKAIETTAEAFGADIGATLNEEGEEK